MRTAELATFIKAREDARIVKAQGIGWKTKRLDPIIAKYRFCNVIRADDRVTKFIFLWAEKWTSHEDLWFAFVVARLFNLPETLCDVASSTMPFKPERMRSAAKLRRAEGFNVFNAAYIVSTNGIAMDKIDYVIDRVLTPLWLNRKRYRPKPGGTLNDFHAKLIEAQGIGSFMAAQVVADLKYVGPWKSSDNQPRDWFTFAASGPGSRRGLNRVMDRPINTTWQEGMWRAALSLLHKAILPKLPASISFRLTAQDLQNCLCEFDKYERARLGEGTPKQLYTPHEEK